MERRHTLPRAAPPNGAGEAAAPSERVEVDTDTFSKLLMLRRLADRGSHRPTRDDAA